MTVWNILGLSSFDRTIYKLFKSSTGFVGSGLHFVFGRSIHDAIRVIKVFPVVKRYKVFELRLDDFVGPLALKSNSIVADITFTVDLKGECISR